MTVVIPIKEQPKSAKVHYLEYLRAEDKKEETKKADEAAPKTTE